MRYTFASLTVIAVALLTTIAVGIETSPRATSYHAPTFPSSPPEAWHGHSSTAYEGALRGTAVLLAAPFPWDPCLSGMWKRHERYSPCCEFLSTRLRNRMTPGTT
jgi:hypothetical protein